MKSKTAPIKTNQPLRLRPESAKVLRLYIDFLSQTYKQNPSINGAINDLIIIGWSKIHEAGNGKKAEGES